MEVYYYKYNCIRILCFCKCSINNSFDSSVKTAMKAFEACVAAGNKEEAVKAYQFLCKKLDKSITKGVHNKKYVARQKSRCAKALNQLA